jgi:hypothetical protein
MSHKIPDLLVPVTIELRHVLVRDVECDLPKPGEPMNPGEPNATVTLLTYDIATGTEVTVKLRTPPAATKYYLEMIRNE